MDGLGWGGELAAVQNFVPWTFRTQVDDSYPEFWKFRTQGLNDSYPRAGRFVPNVFFF